MFEIVEAEGAPAAMAKYRDLRNQAELGRYNFGEWEVNELARRPSEAGKADAAIAMLELNGEFHPASAEIDILIGEQYHRRGDDSRAILRYRAA